MSKIELPFTGGCVCGAVRYGCTAEPVMMFKCHCRDCQRVTGGKEIACGWLKDKYGLCWQIVPTVLLELISSKDAAKSQRVMQAMMNMVKLDIKKLKQAYEQG